MRQLTQKLKSGEMKVQEVPTPVCSSGMVLVRNHFSLISAGTEGSTVQAARKSLLGKAKERPEQVKQVMDVLRQQGPVQTYRAVMKKLDAYSPLGYSCAGEVIGVAGDVEGFSAGDRIACAGAGYASHAEVVSVPTNLCVKLEPDANLRHAAYNTVAAVALQGIRQADLRLGETCVVVGLGLIGQLTCLMLKASGVHVAGVDIDGAMVDLAQKHCADLALQRSASSCSESIREFSAGAGVDAVIITAASSSLDPINFSGEIARKKGKIIIVGAVPTGFDRDPHFYRKELEVRMSCSYGPGRYDLNYEEKGHDYPLPYVRWTENRNMQAFQLLVQSRQIDVDYLTTHVFPLAEAEKAYSLILDRSESFLGILLSYDAGQPLCRDKIVTGKVKPAGAVTLAFVGAGSYAQGHLLPNISPKDGRVTLKGVLTASGSTSKRVAERFGFEFCTSEEKDIFSNDSINTVFIATRHDSHGEYVKKGLKAGKHIFVEKPLCLTEQELVNIEVDYLRLAQGGKPPLLMVGFNRRFSPLAQFLKEQMGSGPMSMIYRVNAGAIPVDNWIQHPQIGGGRVIGEVCHFIDFLVFMCGSLPFRVSATALPDDNHLNDVVNLNLEFADGSVGTIAYFSNGAKSLEKEYVEIYRGGTTGILRDFKEAEFHGGSKPVRKKLLNQDKGQKTMVDRFIHAVKNGESSPVSAEELFAVTRTTFKTLESLRCRESMSINASG